jgi:hypothetical protein
MSQARPAPAPARGEELDWVTGLLLGGDPDAAAHWAIMPNLRHPRLLVPLGSPRAAAAALRQFNDGMTQRARLMKALVGAGFRSKGTAWLLRRRGLVVDGAPGPLLELAERVLHEGDLAFAITLGPIRPNRKPVVQVVRGDGTVLAYMKVGWNDLTRGLVRNEAEVLQRLETAGPRTFQTPRLLHQGDWQGLDVTICSALPTRLWRRGRLHAPPPPSVLREIAALGGVERATLAASRYWQRLRGRLQPVRAGDGRAAQVIDTTLQELEAAPAPVAFGSWHGDFAPWNLRATGDRLFVWDWERSAAPVPVGFDLLHFHYQVAVLAGGQPAPAAARIALARSAGPLRALGQQPHAGELLMTVYLLELLCRYGEAEVSAMTGRPDQVSASLLDALAGRLAGPSR